MTNDIRTVLDGPLQVGGSKGTVDDQRQTVCMGNVRNRADIRHVETRIANRLAEHHFGVALDRLGKVLRILGVDEGAGDAELRQDVVELGVGTTVQVAGRDNVIPLLTDVDGLGSIEAVQGEIADILG